MRFKTSYICQTTIFPGCVPLSPVVGKILEVKMANNNLWKMFALLLVIFFESSECHLGVNFHCHLDKEPETNTSLSLTKNGAEIGTCSWTGCANSSGCHREHKGINKDDTVEYHEEMNIQPHYFSLRATPLDISVLSSPTCSMLLLKTDLSIGALCEWRFVQEDIAVSFMTKNKTSLETVFHQENKMNSSFPNIISGHNKLMASFTLNDLSSHIAPVTCYISKQKERKSCGYPTMLEIRGSSYSCKHKGDFLMDMWLMKRSNRQMIRTNSNQSPTIQINMVDGDEVFVVCGEEGDDVIEVHRIAKVIMLKNCYIANIEQKADETVFIISPGCTSSAQSDENDKATGIFSTNSMTTERPGLGSQAKATTYRLKATGKQSETTHKPFVEQISLLNAFAFILLVAIVICCIGTCLYLIFRDVKKTKNDLLCSSGCQRNIIASHPKDHDVSIDMTRGSLTDFPHQLRVGQGVVNDTTDASPRELCNSPVLPRRGAFGSPRFVDGAGRCSTQMEKNKDSFDECAMSSGVCNEAHMKKDLSGTMERCQQDNMKNIKTSNETIYCTVNEVVTERFGVKTKSNGVLVPSTKLPCNVLAEWHVCGDPNTEHITKKTSLPEEAISLQSSPPLPKWSSPSSPDDFCLYAKPKKIVKKTTISIGRSNSSPGLVLNRSANSYSCANFPQTSEKTGAKYHDAEPAFGPSQSIRSTSEPNFCARGGNASCQYVSVKPSRLSYSIDNISFDDPNVFADMEINDPPPDHEPNSEQTYSKVPVMNTVTSTYDKLQRLSFERRVHEQGQRQACEVYHRTGPNLYETPMTLNTISGNPLSGL